MPSTAQLARLERERLRFETLRRGRDDLVRLLDESEVSEAVYNSNAIENSALTIEETERILLAAEVSRHMNLREVHEAQNLARVTDYIRTSYTKPLDLDRLLLLHQMLLGNIDEGIAGRFREAGEYVRVGTHVAPAPEVIESLLQAMLVSFAGDLGRPTRRLAVLHLEFERIHPFNDGNGHIGRVLLNDALYRLGFPPVIIRNKGKDEYYSVLRTYDASRDPTPFESRLVLLMLESLHRRNAYLNNETIKPVVDVARQAGTPTNTMLNQARRQTIPALRERGVWKIGALR